MMFLMHNVCTDRIAKGNSALERAHIVTVSTTKINEQRSEVQCLGILVLHFLSMDAVRVYLPTHLLLVLDATQNINVCILHIYKKKSINSKS